MLTQQHARSPFHANPTLRREATQPVCPQRRSELRHVSIKDLLVREKIAYLDFNGFGLNPDDLRQGRPPSEHAMKVAAVQPIDELTGCRLVRKSGMNGVRDRGHAGSIPPKLHLHPVLGAPRRPMTGQ